LLLTISTTIKPESDKPPTTMNLKLSLRSAEDRARILQEAPCGSYSPMQYSTQMLKGILAQHEFAYPELHEVPEP